MNNVDEIGEENKKSQQHRREVETPSRNNGDLPEWWGNEQDRLLFSPINAHNNNNSNIIINHILLRRHETPKPQLWHKGDDLTLMKFAKGIYRHGAAG